MFVFSNKYLFLRHIFLLTYAPGGMANAWAMGLVQTINNTKQHLISSELAVVIHDKYPKAQHHYLVLPKQDIATIFDLTPTDLPLLEELHLLAINIIEAKQLQREQFKIGFHAQPSMERLHLHVISKDFVSDCLKTKKHWNSFNTALFIDYKDLYEEVQRSGRIDRLPKEELNRLKNLPLCCNQCSYVAKYVPELKKHLLEHWKS